VRDLGYGILFKSTYDSPVIEALTELRAPYAEARKPRARDEHAKRSSRSRSRRKRAALRRR
jgi:hypothetical protein